MSGEAPIADGAITPEGLEALKAELNDLETEGRRAMAERILAARELGDLKENAEYHIAKEDQAHLETRIKRLSERLRSARVVEVPVAAGDTVLFGATVTVVDEASGREATYTIVGPTEADMAAGKLSAESPVAQALLNKKVGATATFNTPRGERKLRIDRLGT
ncbi:MAG: transcription elongation factor GreA [Solirubrobacteraceae bacterium]|jgi:transcription elongation factor GreA|nr:transcription elongation factor GreA [Solirubrobacteraceae bacterium]